MSRRQHPLDQMDVSPRVLKRAQYEAFAFSISADHVRVQNRSHATPADHTYRVRIVDGRPETCTCPADDRFDGACKHRVAVAIRPPILDAAIAAQVSANGTARAVITECEVPFGDCT